MKLGSYISLFFLLLHVTNHSFAQSSPSPSDSVIVSKHSPKKAVILSAILPGAGQFYNKKYWKIPVIYAAGSAFVYFAAQNQSKYSAFRKGFQLLSDTNLQITSVMINNETYNALQCKGNRDLFKRQRDLNIFATILIYTLNIIDANVDGHLYDFDMSDDLSLQIKPASYQQHQNHYYGLNFTFSF
ncbi:MAG: hypothetical protein HYZ42_07835 [Bacteroidetes bacterium]|nr:hypothetical protein [Bacteroidota bacterium]